MMLVPLYCPMNERLVAAEAKSNEGNQWVMLGLSTSIGVEGPGIDELGGANDLEML